MRSDIQCPLSSLFVEPSFSLSWLLLLLLSLLFLLELLLNVVWLKLRLNGLDLD